MFVLLEHDTTRPTGPPPPGRDVHWDLLIEVPGAEHLATWRLARNPLETTIDIPAQRIQDHRPLYLDFEGEVSGDRGFVRRLERGPGTIEHLTENTVVVVLEGERLRGRFEVARAHGGRLVFRKARA